MGESAITPTDIVYGLIREKKHMYSNPLNTEHINIQFILTIFHCIK